MKPLLSVLVALLALAPVARAYDHIKFLEPLTGAPLARPIAAAASAERTYVLDEKKGVLLVYGADGALVETVGSTGRKNGQFVDPGGVAVGPSGKVYVADTGNNRVQILDRDGGFVYSFGEKGSEPGHLRSPRSVAVGADGRIYVADTGNDRVQVFTEEGILLYGIGGSGKEPGRLSGPTRVAVDPSDQVYVLDKGNDRIEKFDASAKFVRDLPLDGNDLVVDAYGFFYVLDGRNGKVIELSPEGLPLGKFGSYGTGVGQLKKAEGIALSADGDILVLDTGNSRVARIQLTNKLKRVPLPVNPAARMTVTGPSRSWPVTASALAAHGDSLYAYLPQGGPFGVVDADGKVSKRFGEAKGKGESVTRVSGGLAVSVKLGVYASDTPGSRLQHFSLDGKWLANIGESTGFFDSKKKEGRMRAPNGVAINDEGTVYVADTGNRRVDAFSPDGVFVFSVGPKLGQYELQEPVAVAWDKAGFLYIVDKSLKKVFKCEPSGAFLAAWGEEGDGAGQFKSPTALAYDGRGYLYVLDSVLQRVSVYSRAGKWMTDFFAGGRAERELADPAAVAVQGDRLVVSDRGKGKLVSFDLHPLLAPPADLSTATKQGIVSLSWPGVDDRWRSGYRVFRASASGGPFAAVADAKETTFDDSDVAQAEDYWYRVATVAATKDVGPWGPAVRVFVPAATNRAPVEISTVTLGNIFAANYKWYLKHPVGSVTVTNNVNVPYLKVKVTFKLKDYMDFGFDTVIPKLEPKQSAEIPLIATLNNKVLEVTEDTPIQAEFSLAYFENGDAKTVSLTKPLRLFSRNAITWDDTRKIANFVTYKDGPVKDFKAVVAADLKDPKAASLNPAVVKAMKIWNALGAYGVKFAANPANPFESAHDDPNFPVDYTQYPRETLKRKSGQCSDLTSLYAALLEDNEVRVALVDYPGHITLMFDTEAADAAEAGLPPDLLVEHEGSMWLPVEVTYVGKPFDEAVSKAAYAYKAEAEKGRVKVIDLDKTFEEYEAVTMPPTDFAPAMPDTADLQRRYSAQVAVLSKMRGEYLARALADRLKADPDDEDLRIEQGLVALQSGDRAAAAAAFGKVLEKDPKNVDALNDMGGLAFAAGDYAEAEKRFLAASAVDPKDGDVWLNLVKTAAKLNEADKARKYGAKASALTPAYKPFVESLINGL